MSAQYIITDWASNVLQYNEKFNFSAYGVNKGVPMEFKSFDDAQEYIEDMKLEDEDLTIEVYNGN